LFYQLIVHDGGIMNGRFTQEEVSVIREWILGLVN
jgi:hypothetical protein